jgi:hypothetical protein
MRFQFMFFGLFAATDATLPAFMGTSAIHGTAALADITHGQGWIQACHLRSDSVYLDHQQDQNLHIYGCMYSRCSLH